MERDATLSAYENALNEAIREAGYKYGPVTLERIETLLPNRRSGLIATDANGRQSTVNGEAEMRRSVNSTYSRNRWRDNLDRELAKAERIMADALGSHAYGEIRVIPHDSMDGQSDNFLCFHVHAILLSESLAPRSTRIDYWPHDPGRSELLTNVKRQGVRKSLLAGRDRMDILECCPVLARKMLLSGMHASWLDLIEMALEDQQDRQMPKFDKGKLVQTVELKKSVRWANQALLIYEQLPQSVLSSLPGKPLSTLVVDPIIPENAVIRKVKQRGKRTSIVTDMKPILLKDVMKQLKG